MFRNRFGAAIASSLRGKILTRHDLAPQYLRKTEAQTQDANPHFS